MLIKRKLLLNGWFVLTLAIMFIFLLVAQNVYGQNSKSFNFKVKINGEESAIQSVIVNLTSNSLVEPINVPSNSNGWVKFPKLEAGDYTVTPSKGGFFFTPSSLELTFGENSPKRTFVTFLSKEGKPDLTIPFEEDWAGSAHADKTAEAFMHWDEDGEIPESCAKCHSTPGIIDFLGDDGTEAGVVNSPAPIGTVITCEACHNETAINLSSVTFPSGKVVEGLGHESICMTCHQGRSSTPDVNASIAAAAVENDDTVSEVLSFINIHYFAAAATLYGKFAEGGYQYDGKEYDGRLNHFEGINRCIECHDQHTLKIRIELCSTCHNNVKEQDDLKNVRTNGSLVDYDGDGDMEEGVYFEIDTMREKLLEAIMAYGNEVTGVPIVYETHTYPYFFIDTNKNGSADDDEANFGNQYNAWTPRLIKATYNYQTSVKDPGAFAHGGKYVIQLLYDSLEDINLALTNPVNIAGMTRDDEGHFRGSAEAFRHWDEDGEVAASCARCHGAGGFETYIENDTNLPTAFANGMFCSTCHDGDVLNESNHSRREIEEVEFPSGLTADLGKDSNLCMTCHQGRNSKSSVDEAINASEGPYSFINIHYYPVAAVLFGTDVQGGYEFDGKNYRGQNTFGGHSNNFNACHKCHMGKGGTKENESHNVTRPNPANCVTCHGNDVSQPNPGSDADLFEFRGIRPDGFLDFDGDTVITESLWSEVNGLETALYAEIQKYGTETGNPIVYDAHTYPYFFNDLNSDGVTDDEEVNFGNRYTMFTADLLKAAYNYQSSRKEPGGYIHNSEYMSQLLVDSIEALGGDISAFTWR